MNRSKSARFCMIVLQTGLILATILFTVGDLQAQQVQKSFKARQGDRLKVDLKTGGSLTMTGWDQQEVAVVTRKHGRDAERIEVDIEDQSSGVIVRSEYLGRSKNYSGGVDIEVKVPRRYDLDVSTMGGELHIEGVEGTFEGQTMGGEISLQRLKGSVSLRTMGGEINVRDADLEGTVATMGGDVVIDGVAGGLKGSTMGGKVQYVNTRDAARKGKSNKEVRIHTMGGEITVDDAPAGADLHTMGGEITVRNAFDHVKANTMGGEIDIVVNGWVEASTMGGDVEVTMTGSADKRDRHVELSSMGGDITLTIPRGLSADVEIELAYTRKNEGEYDIHSDLDLEKEVSDRWFSDDDTPRKKITATGRTGDGKNRIRIKTINGNVYLREAD